MTISMLSSNTVLWFQFLEILFNFSSHKKACIDFKHFLSSYNKCRKAQDLNFKKCVNLNSDHELTSKLPESSTSTSEHEAFFLYLKFLLPAMNPVLPGEGNSKTGELKQLAKRY